MAFGNALKFPEQPEENGEDNADDDHRGDGKIKAEIFLFHADIAG